MFCDNCAVELTEPDTYWISYLPCDIDSANEGESAVLCGECYRALPDLEG